MNEKMQEISMMYSKNGPMLTQAQTSRLLSKTTARIAQMVKEKKLEGVECLGVKMVTLSSIINYIEKR